MRGLAERLLRTIRKQEFMRAGDRVAVAVSGGADSVALLLLLLELRGDLGIVLSVAHVNHKLRGEESEEDERFVTALAEKHGLELMKRSLPVSRDGTGIEDAARKLRYEFFGELAGEARLTKIATAHTLDDQAETVLLRIFRGTGIRGLCGVLPRRTLKKDGRTAGEVVRPLLGFRRAELREYLRAQGQIWREDSSNEDTTFLRNRLRQRLMPMITSDFGDAAMERIAELAEIARAEEELGSQYPVPGIQNPRGSHAAVGVEQLLALPLAAGRRVLRAWLEMEATEASVSFRLIEEILDLARGPAGKELPVAGDAAAMVVRRGRNELSLENAAEDAGDYEYVLAVPGEILVPELGARFAAEVVEQDEAPAQEREMLLDVSRLGKTVTIRNWRAGDRFWPAYTRQEKKVKEILSDKHITGREKKLWPVAECRGELVWMRGCAVPAALQARSGKGIRIREIAG
jgi:tRNA(Ile)-lysidine synthase